MPDRAISDLTMASKSVGTGPPPVLPIFGGRILLLDERRRRPGVVGPVCSIRKFSGPASSCLAGLRAWPPAGDGVTGPGVWMLDSMPRCRRAGRVKPAVPG